MKSPCVRCGEPAWDDRKDDFKVSVTFSIDELELLVQGEVPDNVGRRFVCALRMVDPMNLTLKVDK